MCRLPHLMPQTSRHQSGVTVIITSSTDTSGGHPVGADKSVISLPLSLSLHLSLSLSLLLSLSLSLCLCLSVCLSVSLPFSLSLSVCLCLSVSVSVCLSLSLSPLLSLSVHFCVCLSLSLSHTHTLSLSACLYIFIPEPVCPPPPPSSPLSPLFAFLPEDGDILYNNTSSEHAVKLYPYWKQVHKLRAAKKPVTLSLATFLFYWFKQSLFTFVKIRTIKIIVSALNKLGL